MALCSCVAHVDKFGLAPKDWSVLDKLAEGATAMIDVPGTLTLCESVLEHNPRARAWSFYSMLARSDRPETLFFKMPRHKSLHWITFARHWWLQALCLVLEGTRMPLSC